ncbi:hypothetical protein GQR60_00855 [Labilibaculum sp. A4]|uniref:restriction endonuclease subunit S n=1 Tax=Labilibaculum euxinus TaxID=2686357 RepID=UPI000F621673|nr:restriction endonuclease subunit S [Labilibaculum euxinus]MDQ1769364.1 restriction endonuclease subunit S [Labilibaculum euxinus]MWN74890.1 hypothetical protein [Labilibaculum euxinus]
MSKLPLGWKVYSLEDIKVKSEIGLVRAIKDQDHDKEYRYIKMNNISIDGKLNIENVVCINASQEEIDRYSLVKGDLLFNTRNSVELVGKTALFDSNDKEILFNNNIMRLQFKDSILPYFINYAFKAYVIQNQLENFKSGTTNVSAIYYKNLKTLQIPLPSFPEQKRIVSKLDALFQRIDKSIALLQENIQQTEKLMTSVLDEVFMKNIDMIEIFNFVDKASTINPKKAQDVNFTYIDITSINKDIHVIENPKTLIGKDAPSRARKKVQLGDVLFATTRPNLKNIAMVTVGYINPVASTGFCILRAKKNIDNEFLYHCLLSDQIQQQIIPLIRGAQYPAISDKDLLKCKIPNLKYQEQIQIKEKLNSLRYRQNKLTKEQQTKLTNLKALKESLLDKAFKGEL